MGRPSLGVSDLGLYVLRISVLCIGPVLRILLNESLGRQS